MGEVALRFQFDSPAELTETVYGKIFNIYPGYDCQIAIEMPDGTAKEFTLPSHATKEDVAAQIAALEPAAPEAPAPAETPALAPVEESPEALADETPSEDAPSKKRGSK